MVGVVKDLEEKQQEAYDKGDKILARSYNDIIKARKQEVIEFMKQAK